MSLPVLQLILLKRLAGTVRAETAESRTDAALSRHKIMRLATANTRGFDGSWTTADQLHHVLALQIRYRPAMTPSKGWSVS